MTINGDRNYAKGLSGILDVTYELVEFENSDIDTSSLYVIN